MITQEYLKELMHYNPDTGVFTWKVSKGRGRAGSEAGSIHQARRTYYRKIQIDGERHYAHRLAWLCVHGKLPAGQIDHEDGNGLHNLISNLRDVSHGENQRNRQQQSNNTSGVTGVSFHKLTGKWRAQIGTESGRKHLGEFTDIEDAIEAVKAARIEHGFHKNHGRHDDQS